MMQRCLVTLLVVGVLAPTMFFAYAVPARAVPAEIVSDVSAPAVQTAFQSTISAIKNTLSAALDVTNTAANVAKQVKAYVLDPIAFVVSGNLLKSITSGILNFVNKNKLYVQNLPGYLQNVGDIQAYTFLNDFSRNSNSPFAGAITSSLRANYLQQTSMAGFFAANRNTLNRYSPNVNRFLAGDWSQGGAAAWFGLTTQCQNDPYCLYYRAQDQLSRSVEGATSAKLAQLNWGQGFLSWCGSKPGASSTTCDPTKGDFCGGGDISSNGTTANTGSAGGSLTQTGVTGTTANKDRDLIIGQNNSVASKGLVPGDSCTKSDGTEGNIQTPGSIIKDFLSKALGSDIDKLNGVGDIATQLSGIMSNIGTVMKTVDLAAGLFGADGGLNSITGLNSFNSPFANYLNSPDYLGVNTQYISTNPAGQALTTSDLLSRANQYEAAWATIGTAATSASAALTSLIASCPTQTGNAQNVLNGTVNPALASAANAKNVVSAARALVTKTQVDAQSSNLNSSAAYTADIAQLSVMPPSTGDVVAAQQEVRSYGDAQSSSANPLSVSASSALDRLNLITRGAETLQNKPATCPPPPDTSGGTANPPPQTDTGDGGGGGE